LLDGLQLLTRQALPMVRSTPAGGRAWSHGQEQTAEWPRPAGTLILLRGRQMAMYKPASGRVLPHGCLKVWGKQPGGVVRLPRRTRVQFLESDHGLPGKQPAVGHSLAGKHKLQLMRSRGNCPRASACVHPGLEWKMCRHQPTLHLHQAVGGVEVEAGAGAAVLASGMLQAEAERSGAARHQPLHPLHHPQMQPAQALVWA